VKEEALAHWGLLRQKKSTHGRGLYHCRIFGIYLLITNSNYRKYGSYKISIYYTKL